MVPLSYLALTDWKTNKTRVIQFLLISMAVLAVSALIYKMGLKSLAAQGKAGYDVGEQGINQLSTRPLDLLLLAINPRTYWSVFKMWTFPFPFQNTPPLSNLVEKITSFAIMTVWLGIVSASVWVEFTNVGKDKKQEILFKWLAVVICTGFGAVLIIANSPSEIIDHRPHLHLIFSGIVIFTSVYANEMLMTRFSFWKILVSSSFLAS